MDPSTTAEASVHGVFAGCHARLRWAELAIRALGELDPADATAVSLQASNIVHQLRAALDNLLWQLALADGTAEPSPKLSFPIYAVDSKKRRAKLKARLSGLSAEHIASIERIQPWAWPSPESHPLAVLDRLARADQRDVLVWGAGSPAGAVLRQVLGCVEATVRAFQLSVRTAAPAVLDITETTVMQWEESLRMRDLSATHADDTELVQRFGRSLTSSDLSPFDDSDLVHVFAAVRRLLIAPTNPETERLIVLERALSQELALRKINRFRAEAGHA